jgi:signal transduction histidine kinase
LLQRRRTYDERAVSAIVDRAAQMGRLVADMLEMTRLEAGRLELRRAPTDLVEIARACAEQASLLASDRRVDVQAPPHPVVGEWDCDRLAQVLTNLLDNAMKYAPEGEIVVQIDQLPDVARVAIIDHGPGLAADELPRVFEHFFRAPRTASVTAGAGLGLYISKALVEAHGGRLWAKSTPGEGSIFACDLPYSMPKPITLPMATRVLSA